MKFLIMLIIISKALSKMAGDILDQVYYWLVKKLRTEKMSIQAGEILIFIKSQKLHNFPKSIPILLF